MTPGPPVSLGSLGAAATATTIVLTTTAAIVAGDLVVVTISNFSNVAVSSVSDGTNTYVLAKSQAGTANSQIAEFWYKENAAAVNTGASLTVTFASTCIDRTVMAARCNNVITASSLDVHVSNGFTTTTTPTQSPGTIAQVNELVCGFLCVNGNVVTTESPNFGSIVSNNTAGFINLLSYELPTTTTPPSYSPTLGTSSTGVIFVVTFKGINAFTMSNAAGAFVLAGGVMNFAFNMILAAGAFVVSSAVTFLTSSVIALLRRARFVLTKIRVTPPALTD
jgi:hypothetical protein